MGLEATTNIQGLDSTFPLVGDPVSQGDDHIRLIKSVLKTVFPGASGGLNAPVTLTEAQFAALALLTVPNLTTLLRQSNVRVMTGYVGADIVLEVGEIAIYDIVAVTSLLLRIATGDNQLYELNILPNVISPLISTQTILKPNNVDTVANNVLRTVEVGVTGTANCIYFEASETNFTIDSGNTIARIKSEICTRTSLKTITSFSSNYNSSVTPNAIAYTQSRWGNVITTWSSLGTLFFGYAVTGRVMVKRLM